ncbi:MAG: GNAT family N-acetyltransferase [Candidatus Bathyarchaeia archaeon]
MANEQALIRLRLDVDYPYPSRAKSFLYIALGIKKRKSRGYLQNARVIAKMINQSPRHVMAYWFFTPYTIPDKKLLDLLNPERHEVALHVATDPYREWKILENETNRTIKYYTIHGTKRLFAQLLWGRKLGQKQAIVPKDFPLKSFHDFTTFSLDTIRFQKGFEGGKKEAEAWINQNFVLSMHPEWLFKEGKRSGRGPFYDVLKDILETDKELETLRVRKNAFARTAHDVREYERDVVPTEAFLENLSERDIDVFTFLERKWCCPIPNPSSNWVKSEDNVALLEVKDYQSWWSGVGKKTRNMVRRAEKNGVKVTVAEPNDQFAQGISKIYNETPIRQERAFSHYGEPLETVAGNMYAGAKNSTFIGAYLDGELVGFIQMLYGDNIAVVSQILSMQKHWDKALNNALLAKAVEVCASKGQRWLMYGRIGNHPSLDRFKESNGFVSYPITRYYVPLTWRGKVAIRLGLQREFKDALPQSLKKPLIPVMNWVSRRRTRLKYGSAGESNAAD